MNMNITHNFSKRSHDLVGLFEKCNKTKKFSTFMTNVEKQAILDIDNYKRDDYIGDAFEYFIEILIKTHEYSNTIGIMNYNPISDIDTGVDGVGENIVGDKCVVQIKYRSNTESLLTSNNDHLSNMFSSGDTTYGVVSIEGSLNDIESLHERNLISESNYKKEKKRLENSPKRHYVFTTAQGLHHFTDSEMFNDKVFCFNKEKIRKLVDNNKHFWDKCLEIAKKLDPKYNG